jgi:hypothetical protein
MHPQCCTPRRGRSRTRAPARPRARSSRCTRGCRRSARSTCDGARPRTISVRCRIAGHSGVKVFIQELLHDRVKQPISMMRLIRRAWALEQEGAGNAEKLITHIRIGPTRQSLEIGEGDGFSGRGEHARPHHHMVLELLRQMHHTLPDQCEESVDTLGYVLDVPLGRWMVPVLIQANRMEEVPRPVRAPARPRHRRRLRGGRRRGALPTRAPIAASPHVQIADLPAPARVIARRG